ncbi:hypothetical protein DFH28DRAFT_224715 [Melampsora americana]|nr:hypothetical protein DFH28DRAFT_224715 [Melampsora americana]
MIWESLRSKKTVKVDWHSAVLERYPSGEEVIENYIKEFDTKAFTQYILDQNEKTKQAQLSNLKQLTEASGTTTPDQFAEMIQALKPMGNILSILNEQNSNTFLPIFTITRDLKENTKKTILNSMKDYLKDHENFSKPKKNLWIFDRYLKDRLYQQEENQEKEEEGYERFQYDPLLVEKISNEIFKEANKNKLSKVLSETNTKVSNQIANKNFNFILLARRKNPDRYSNLTELEALYIRQCLGSVHSFTLKYKSPTQYPLPKVISEYYSSIFQFYSDVPELRQLAKELHHRYNLQFPENQRHDITWIDLD